MQMYSGLEPEAKSLVDMMYAPMYTKVLFTALELDVFSNLRQPDSAAEMAKKLGWHDRNTGLFLDAVCSLGLLRKETQMYCNSETAERYLVRGNPQYIGDHLIWYGKSFGFEETDLAALVQAGPCAPDKQPQDHISFEKQAQRMRAVQMDGRAEEIVALMRSLPEFSSAKKMLDLGGGSGVLGISIVKAHEHMTGVIFDLPPMEPVIRESICLMDAKGRVEVLTGNYLTNEIGSGYDLILAFGTLNFVKENMEFVMKKLYGAMSPGGVLVCAGDGIDHSGIVPKDMVIGWLPYTLQGEDFRMQRGFLAQAALQTGFQSVHTMTIPMLTGTTEIEIIRKAKPI